ncbi:uncharacterized protein N0V89_010500 [Didymosphaeria variabile]|uniref:Uncharacterized protein n=1 Tax=Didymosphaeria variabile TaxID=1932322 RepID=A0A9W8XBE1_9PLEO|nr:uncharacterized protein N0V89_010500 [Didymosphaeria variabile]KAJ4346569.1 hypothetical protein N0V89_010500 [Didymosphaeria variabile]
MFRWAARPGYGNAQPYYNNNYQQPPPQYSAQPQGEGGYYGGGANQGYYGNNGQTPYGQANGVELQPPQQAHQARGGEDVYSPPPGPPPGKGDGIIR